MLVSGGRRHEASLNEPGLITKVLDILSVWGRENLGRLGWLVSDPYSYEWWGGFKDPFEIGVSAILVQLSRWEAVDKAITRLRENKLLDPYVLAEAPQDMIKELIKGVGFHESKSRTLKEFSILVVRRGGWGAFINRDLNEVRNDLIKIKGIGYETADTILLFAGNKLVLPVSRLARRVLSRVGVNLPASYVRAQQILEKLIPEDLGSYKLFHATLVSISKKYCRSKKPLCAECPLQTICGFPTRNLKT
jgi:endonuclease-3 related protein